MPGGRCCSTPCRSRSGLKAAGWLDAVDAAAIPAPELRPRVLVLQFGGAAGTLAALGDTGLAVRMGSRRSWASGCRTCPGTRSATG